MDNVHERPKVVFWVAVVVAIAVVAGATVTAFAFLEDRAEPGLAAPSPSENETGDGCAGVMEQSIELNRQIVAPSPRTCFELATVGQINIGAAALEPSDIIELLLFDAAGQQLAAAVSAPDWDPTIGITLAPGTYVIEVRGTDSEEVPPFLLHTATFPPVPEASSAPGLGEPSGADDLPSVEQCGDSVPWLAAGAPITVSSTADARAPHAGADGSHFACVDVVEPVFAKFGLESADPYADDAADLTLAIYQMGAGDPELIRVGDDTFGVDPEVSLDLEPGTYLVEATAWHGAPAGQFSFYYDDQAVVFREGEVSPMHAALTPQLCDTVDVLEVGANVTVTDERAYTCLEVMEGDRITIQAATLTDQDLTLEVIGFDDLRPFRLAWTDDNPYSHALADFDPLLDQVIPAGTWVIAVTSYYGDVGHNYDLRAVSGPQH